MFGLFRRRGRGEEKPPITPRQSEPPVAPEPPITPRQSEPPVAPEPPITPRQSEPPVAPEPVDAITELSTTAGITDNMIGAQDRAMSAQEEVQGTSYDTRKQLIQQIQKLNQLRTRINTMLQEKSATLRFKPEIKKSLEDTLKEIKQERNKIQSLLVELEDKEASVTQAQEEKENTPQEEWHPDTDQEVQVEIQKIEEAYALEDIGEQIGELLQKNQKSDLVDLLKNVAQWSTTTEYFSNPHINHVISKTVVDNKYRWGILVKTKKQHRTHTKTFVPIPIEYQGEIESTILPTLSGSPKEKNTTTTFETFSLEDFEKQVVYSHIRDLFNNISNTQLYSWWNSLTRDRQFSQKRSQLKDALLYIQKYATFSAPVDSEEGKQITITIPKKEEEPFYQFFAQENQQEIAQKIENGIKSKLGLQIKINVE